MLRAAILTLLLIAPALARADIAPPPDYVETCTVEKQAGPGRSCVLCSTYHGDPQDKCAKEAGAGFTQACRTRGASVWSEVWCTSGDGSVSMEVPGEDASTPSPAPAAAAADADVPATTPKSGGSCTLGTPGERGAQGLALVLAAGVGFAIMRRRKR